MNQMVKHLTCCVCRRSMICPTSYSFPFFGFMLDVSFNSTDERKLCIIDLCERTLYLSRGLFSMIAAYRRAVSDLRDFWAWTIIIGDSSHLHCASFLPIFMNVYALFSSPSCTRILKTWRICLDIELCQLKNGYRSPTSTGTPLFFHSW